MDAVVDLESIRAAREAIGGVVKHTPVISSVALSGRHGRDERNRGDVVLKSESLQRTGSFKIRGAMNKVASLGAEAARGVTTGSAGNHAQALAFAAAHFGVPCEIVVPVGAPINKVEACRNYGATVIEHGAALKEAVSLSMERARERGTTFCPPFDDVAVIAGQGTLGLELVDDIASLSCVIVPLGGGGLASGVAIAVKSLLPHVRVVGVQAAACAPYCGGAVADGPVLTLADGIAVKHPGEITGPLVSRWLDEIVSVDEDAIADAMVLLMDRAKLVSKARAPSGWRHSTPGSSGPADDGVTCVIVSGGNVDLGLVPGLIRRRENQAGRRLSIFARIGDRPGALAQLLSVFAAGGADLIEVEHLREGLDLHVRQTGIHATFAVRTREQAIALVDEARRQGFDVSREGSRAM